MEVYVKPLWKSREVFLCPKITSFETSGYPGLFSLEEEMGIPVGFICPKIISFGISGVFFIGGRNGNYTIKG